MEHDQYWSAPEYKQAPPPYTTGKHQKSDTSQGPMLSRILLGLWERDLPIHIRGLPHLMSDTTLLQLCLGANKRIMVRLCHDGFAAALHFLQGILSSRLRRFLALICGSELLVQVEPEVLHVIQHGLSPEANSIVVDPVALALASLMCLIEPVE
ncbi:hypothetical protein NM208_g16883 [Fusarium decemcellulare]|uniref:Uncharacterized protein n=1 Tax=Fusarium decemcellulare TaxID=57161 RepID=A0ACC1RBK8_9HYPO|nr:hypothetical protein NM208_g16883 [Fusarium decemcellulare]